MLRTTVPRVQNVLLLLIFPTLLIGPWEFAQVNRVSISLPDLTLCLESGIGNVNRL